MLHYVTNNQLQSRKACAAAKLDFETQNSLLLSEVPKLYEGRIPYFQPSLQAFVKAQVKLFALCGAS